MPMKRRAILFFLLFLLQMGSVPTLAAEPTVAAQGAALIDGKTGREECGRTSCDGKHHEDYDSDTGSGAGKPDGGCHGQQKRGTAAKGTHELAGGRAVAGRRFAFCHAPALL